MQLMLILRGINDIMTGGGKMKTRKHFAISLSVLFVLALALCSCSCGKKTADIDYGDAISFEIMLNEGEDMKEKVVQFTADDVKTDTAYGYNIWAGKHLNFISSANPNIKEGDTITARVTSTRMNSGSWFIEYEKLDSGNITDNTITKDSPSIAGKTKTITLKDSGWYVKSSYKDSYYLGFCVIAENPNESLVANNTKAKVTVKNNSGNVLATQEAYMGDIMNGDIGIAEGSMEILAAYNPDDIQVQFDLDCTDYSKNSSLGKNIRTSDFEVFNVSEFPSSYSLGNTLKITGEVKNNSSEKCNSHVFCVLRKDGKIVFSDSTYLDALNSGESKAFEDHLIDVPDHDSINCYVSTH